MNASASTPGNEGAGGGLGWQSGDGAETGREGWRGGGGSGYGADMGRRNDLQCGVPLRSSIADGSNE